MAYDHRTGLTNRSPIIDSEHRPSPWAQRDHHPPHHHHRQSSSFHSPAINNVMDPESEDSEVSATEGDYGSNFSFPINLPPAPSKPALDNQDSITAHLKELERVEAHNVRKHERLKEKRARKDERIARKRAAQDERIKAIMEARTRRDSRINQRRQRENIAFQRFYEDLDEEETRLQSRLKRLKRGHLVEDAATANRRVSGNSMSPTAPSYSTVPPPAKRHQTSHPNSAEAHTPYPPPPTTHQPSYHFHPGPAHQTPPAPYHPAPPYHSPSYGRSPPVISHRRVGSNLHDSTPNTTNGQNPSPRLPAPISTPAPVHTPTPAPAPAPAPAPPPATTSIPVNHSQPVSAPISLPPRPSHATYDTRPPPAPSHSSTFAAVNQPPSSGFAAVNSMHHTAPATPHAPIPKEEPHRQQPRATEQTPVRTSSAEEKSGPGGSAGNKRTPSTTHPYQMSEAFANRHHHCERTDSLNRGIWTWYGLHGSKEYPTAPPTEMYLVCNHDGCRRIDWRTVHGLQCHIVKNHEQPKGTIGSLEKALAAYGVPVREIEEHERQHGPGSGGTMADPKNSKVRTKAKDLADRRDTSERETSMPGTTPFQLQKHQSHDSDSPHLSHVPTNSASRKRSHSVDQPNPGPEPESTPVETSKQPSARAVSGFQAVNASWQGINATPSKPPHARDWPMNPNMRNDKKGSPLSAQAHPASTTPQSFWPSWQAKNDGAPNPTPPTADMNALREAAPVKSHTTPEMLVRTRPAEPEKNETITDVRSRPSTSEKKDVQRDSTGAPSTKVETVEDTPMSEPKVEIEDVPMTNTIEKPFEEPAKPSTPPPPPPKGASENAQTQDTTPAPRESIEPRQSHGERVNQEQRTPVREDQRTDTKDDRIQTKSPEMSNKRIPSAKRESRRSSMATAFSTRAGMERTKDDDVDTNYTANNTSKAESVEDDSDSITVNLIASTEKHRDRDRDSDRMKTPVRLPNGRFSRTKRTR